MNVPGRLPRIILLLLLVFIATPAQPFDYEAGEIVIRHGVVDDDLYLAGAQVELAAAVTGDAVVAGGELDLQGDIGGDVLAAGGTIALRGTVNDDARLAGGDLRIQAQIGDDLLAAGGRIHLGRLSAVTGGAWLSGGDIRLDGTVEQGLHASGGRVVITGTINGDVELWAEQIIIAKTAVITGRLHYKSPREAEIENEARIDGGIDYAPVDVEMKSVLAGAVAAVFVLLASLVLAAVVLYLLFADYSLAVCQTLKNEPWLSLGLGLAVFAGVPVVIVVLLSTLIGTLLALMLLAVYLVMLLAGYFIGALFVANTGLGLLGKDSVSKTLRALSLAGAIFALVIIGLLPLVGSLLTLAVVLAGTGALFRQMYLARSA
jgi:cytoskeletal protein CcmA (bactofilin family)